MLNQKTILFVDDEPNVLSSLRRLLRREDWNLVVADSADAGLVVLQRQPVDMVVSDMRMPGKDGATFLKEVKALYPDTIRIILTGYSERDAVSRAFAEADIHEMISKPWDDEELKSILRNAFSQPEQQETLSPGLLQILNKIDSLPALPRAYAEVRRLIQSSDEVSAAAIAEVIVQDPAMAAKLLRIANSAFFGQRREIDTVTGAIVVLGMEMVSTLILSAGVFTSFETEPIEGFTQDDLWRHSVGCGLVAKHLAETCSRNQHSQETAMLAGSLHDLGKLVFAQYMHDAYEVVVRTAMEGNLPIVEVETEKLGASHAEVGAYLADRWHLPNKIVEAIRFHNYPSQGGDSELAYLIHVADFIVHSLHVGASACGTSPSMELSAMSRLGVTVPLASLQSQLKTKLAEVE